MACNQHHLMQKTNPSFRLSVGFYLVSAPLKTLNLYYNQIGDEGAIAIAGALPR
jgi:hypothetical protein